MGIGPTQPAWKAGVLPLNYTRTSHNAYRLYQKSNLLSNIFLQFLKKFDLFCFTFYFLHLLTKIRPYFLNFKAKLQQMVYLFN